MTAIALWVRLLFPLFAKVKIAPGFVDRVKTEAENSTIVYTAEVQGLLDYVLLLYLCRSHGLPMPMFTNSAVRFAMRPLILLPFYFVGWLIQLFVGRRRPLHAYRRRLLAGAPSLLFLKRGRVVMLPGTNIGNKYLAACADVQRRSERPMVFLPLVVIWSPTPEKHRRSVVDLLVGHPNQPGIRKMLSFLTNPARVLVTCGTPVHARTVLSEGPADDDEQVARKLSWHIHRAFDEEEKVVRGPMLKSAAQIRSEMMADAVFTSRVEEIARSRNLPLRKARRRASKCIKEIAADFRITYIEILSLFLTPIFRRVFSSFVVDRDAIRTIKEAARDTPVVLMPCHRSHVDYLVISYLLYLHGIIPPHIAAGSNLSFFPLGHLFRHSGAFFIRRKTGGDEIYAAALSYYVRKLLKEGYPIEFFAEGGRSRTGKTLPPRFGILGYVADAVCAEAVREVTIVPVALSYERIMEVEGYSAELSGGEKRREDISGLVKSAQVLDSRYGRLYLTAGRPVKVAAFLENRAGKPVQQIADTERRELVKTLGYMVLGRINRATVVNPSGIVACALLSHHRRGISKVRFLEACGFLLDFASKRGHSLSVTFDRALNASLPEVAKAKELAASTNDPRVEYLARGRAVEPVLDEAIEVFASQGHVSVEHFGEDAILSVLPRARTQLNYYRNNVIHVFQREALSALSLLARSHQPGILRYQVEDDVLYLSRLFKKEFIFRVGDFSRGILAALEALEAEGIVRLDQEGNVTLVPENVDRLQLFRNMVLPIVEGYLLAARYAPMVRWKGAMRQKDLAAAILSRSIQDYRQGEVSCQEALSSVSIANALDRFMSMELLTTVDTGLDAGRVRLGKGESLEGLAAVERRLETFVDVRRSPA